MANYTMLHKYGKPMCILGGEFLFLLFFISVFYIFGAFLIVKYSVDFWQLKKTQRNQNSPII